MRIEIAVDARNRTGEAPCWDEREGRLWWVDIPAREILAWGPGEPAPRRWPAPDFPAAVVAREGGGRLVAMRSGLYFWDASAPDRFIVFATPDVERAENRANEGRCDPAGRFWLGTMRNNLEEDGSPRGDSGNEPPSGALYRVQPDGRWSREVDGVGVANTLAWADGGRVLYFGDTAAHVIHRFDMDEEGGLSNRRVLTEARLPGRGDGSAIDAEGCLWNARYGAGRLIRLRPDGRVDREVALPVTNPTSCCFGGPDLRTLYVTSAAAGLDPAAGPHEGAVLALDPGVPGAPSYRFAG